MSPPRVLPAFAETPVLLALGFVAVFAALIPLAPGGGLAAPDLLYCLVVAWVVRRPAHVARGDLVLGLFADVMLSRPLGLGALALMLLAEVFRRRAVLFYGAPFLVEWLAAAAGFAAMLAAMHLALASSPIRRALRLAAISLRHHDRLSAGGARPRLVPSAPRAPNERSGVPAWASELRRQANDAAPRITRRGLMLGIQAGVIGALGWRMRDLQILQNEHYRLLAEENRVNIRLIPPARGIITDRNGRLLAGNRQNYRIVMVREQAGEPRRCSRGSPASCRCRPTVQERALREMQAAPPSCRSSSPST